MLLLTLLAACYDAPDLPTIPWEAPPLVSADDSPIRICAPERPARVACVTDGDTFDSGQCGDGGETWRMLGINAPETEKPGQEAECYADIAATELRRLLLARNVVLTHDRECTDVYRRTLGYVWIDARTAFSVLDAQILDDLERLGLADLTSDDGLVMLNAYLLVAGFVRRFDEEWVEPLRWEAELIAAERLAQVRRAGLWSACD